MSIPKFIKNSYIFTSFFWSVIAKGLNAVFSFISVPLLLGYFGKADYGLLSIATACNGYLQLMDLGMNTGAVKFFAQWEAEGKRGLIQRASNTNTTFYLLISIVNVIALLSLAWFGEGLFSVTHEEFLKLRSCFYVLAIFSPICWAASAYTQLLTAYKKIAFTMQVNSVLLIFRIVLVVVVLKWNLSLINYYFCLTALVAIAIVPYIIKCKKDSLLDSLRPALYWKEFSIIFAFSLSIFALTLFQVTATQSRPIVLSIFAEQGANAVADYRIVEVFPQFIIMVCGSLTGIFLPRSSEMLVKCTNSQIQDYINAWTKRTTIVVCIFSFPLIIGAHNIIVAYVGAEYDYLYKWLQLWCLFLIGQMHTSPAYSFVLAKGNTKALVYGTFAACVISIVINIFLCKYFLVGSAIIGYCGYVVIIIIINYVYFYKRSLNLKRVPILLSFFKPFLVGVITTSLIYIIDFNPINISSSIRIQELFIFALKSVLWVAIFIPVLCLTGIFKKSDLKE